MLGIIAGEIAPDAGDVWIDGHSLTHMPLLARARMAYVPDNCLASPLQTRNGLLEQVASDKNTALSEEVLDLAYRLGLEPHLDKRFEQMSTGTRCWPNSSRRGLGIGWCCLQVMMLNWCGLAG